MTTMIIFTLFNLGLMAWSIQSRHILNCLILLEFFILITYYSAIWSTSSHCMAILVTIPLFVVSVVAAAIGLSTLIPLARSKGGDYFSALNLLW